MTRLLESAQKAPFLSTMRADVDPKRLPIGLANVLRVYDTHRENDGWDDADCRFNQSDWRHGDTYRLRLGLSRLTVRGVTLMARKHSHLCGAYVAQHTGDLMTLQGLFYWNGGDELVTRILLNAWRRGAKEGRA